MEKRNIKVTLKQAIELYNSDNESLRNLALTAYTESELDPNIDGIYSKVNASHFYTAVPIDEDMKYRILEKLAIIAKYFNGNWKKNTHNTGYFLGKHHVGADATAIDTYSNIIIYEQSIGQYAGVVYFKNNKDAIRAIKLLGDRVKYLFN